MMSFRPFVLAAFAAPLALALAACGSGEEATEGPIAGDPIASIAAPDGQSWVETASVTPEGGVVIGNPEAPLKLVEYASHTCHVCAAFSQEGAAGMDEYVATGVVSYEIRNLIRDPFDLTISMLARCGTPAAFHPLVNQAWGNFDALMQGYTSGMQQAQQAPQERFLQTIAEAGGLLDFFAARGVSRDQAMQCLANTDEARQIAERSQAQSDELAITGTPTFFLNGQRLETTSWGPTRAGPGVEAALQAAGAR